MSFTGIMYGGPPSDPFAKRFPVEPMKPYVLPADPLAGVVKIMGGYVPVDPAPETAQQTVNRMRDRIEWLKRELSMHEAWKHELDVLEKMVATWNTPEGDSK